MEFTLWIWLFCVIIWCFHPYSLPCELMHCCMIDPSIPFTTYILVLMLYMIVSNLILLKILLYHLQMRLCFHLGWCHICVNVFVIVYIFDFIRIFIFTIQSYQPMIGMEWHSWLVLKLEICDFIVFCHVTHSFNNHFLTVISVTYLLVMGIPDFKYRTTYPPWFFKFTVKYTA